MNTETTKPKGFGIAAMIAVLLIAAVIAPAMAGVEGIRHTLLKGGQLAVDETGGITCTTDAANHNRPYALSETYRIVTDHTYEGTPDVTHKIAHFKLTGPDGSTDDKSIRDQLIVDDSDDGTIIVLGSPSGPGDYHYSISCSEGGKSAEDMGAIK